MRLDHIAYRSSDRKKTAKFFQDCLGYSIATEFDLEFEDGSTTKCVAMIPPETRPPSTDMWKYYSLQPVPYGSIKAEYHAPPEIFISDGVEGSIVAEWVKERGGIGGIHHIAYQVEDVETTMHSWRKQGYAEFLSDVPLECPGLKQVFTKPSELTGVIYELISRTGKGFCEDNVKGLMESTKGA